jgi:Family of unknown function (DUF5947)
MGGPGGLNSPLGVLSRITAQRPPPVPAGERCEMCATPIDEDAHSHVVNIAARSLLCTCRACYLLFTDQQADLRYRAVPDRYLSFPNFHLDHAQWDALEIPVGLAFLFHNSQLDRIVAFYPGPAGATESELALDAWADVVAANPGLGQAAPDVEALIVRGPAPDRAAACFLVPIDACYQLVGELRQVWRGFDGGADARRRIEGFFETVAARSRPGNTASAP